MKVDTILATSFGTAYTLLNIGSADLISSFILGLTGAIGAFCGTQLVKWIIKKIKQGYSNTNDTL